MIKISYLITLLILIPAISQAGSNPFKLYKKDKLDNKLLNYFCHERQLIKFKRTKKIGAIRLSISDFDYRSGHANKIGVEFDDDKSESKGIYNSFVESIKKFNLEKEIALYIYEDKSQFFGKCLDENKSFKNSENRFDKCLSKTNTFIGSKYGNTIGQFIAI